MIIPGNTAASVAADMESSLSRINHRRRGFFGKITRYLDGFHDLPYMPRGASAEYRDLARQAITNWLPLISETFTQILFVDDYRAEDATTSASAWRHWQANKLDARQTIVHRAALEYGVGYVLILPGETDGEAVIKPYHPTRVWADYEDEDDDFPVRAMIRKGKTLSGDVLYELYDDEAVYTLSKPKNGGEMKVVWVEMHNMGYVPLVRFRDRLDGKHKGIIFPLIREQDKVNTAVFNLLIALQYASFRQRWATGLAIPTDENGDPVEPFQAAVDRLWVSDSQDASFGEFGQTEVSGHLATYDSQVSTMAALGRVSPHTLLGKLVNLSAEALAAAESVTQRAGGQYKTIFGESWELCLSVAAQAAGDPEPDDSSQVRWRDSEARSMAAQVDALGKMVQMLQVPVEAAWRMIPGVTKADVDSWLKMKPANATGIEALADALTKSQTPTAGPATRDDLPTATQPLPDAGS